MLGLITFITATQLVRSTLQMLKRGVKLEKLKPVAVATFVLSLVTFGLSAAYIPKRVIIENYHMFGNYYILHVLAVVLSVCNICIFTCNDFGLQHELLEI